MFPCAYACIVLTVKQGEITKIAGKRSDFEHKLNVRGARPADYVRYIEFEKNIDVLRRKRAKRQGARGKGHLVAMRIMSIFNRATRQFPGDLSLWTEYLDYAKQQHAYKTIVEVLTKMVRLHPTKPKIWMLAANLAFHDNGDMAEARSYMQRGLRFCKSSNELWVAYARLEMLYLLKLARRRSILGLDKGRKEQIEDDGQDADIIALPATTANEMVPETKPQPEASDQAYKVTPASQGAIPIAIFDSAIQQFEGPAVPGRLFDMCCEFTEIPAVKIITAHMVMIMTSRDSSDPTAQDCFVREPLAGVPTTSPEFAKGLRESIRRLQKSSSEAPSLSLTQKTVAWVSSYLQRDLDPDIRTVLVAIATSALSQYQLVHDRTQSGSSEDFATMLKQLDIAEASSAVQPALTWALRAWPGNASLQAVK